MRIHDAYTKLDRSIRTDGPTKGPGAAGSKTGGASSTGPAAPAAGTTVKMSARALELSAGSAQSDAKVDALRAKVQNGSLAIDAHHIASRLVGSDE